MGTNRQRLSKNIFGHIERGGRRWKKERREESGKRATSQAEFIPFIQYDTKCIRSTIEISW